jgi:hypothetical protein
LRSAVGQALAPFSTSPSDIDYLSGAAIAAVKRVGGTSPPGYLVMMRTRAAISSVIPMTSELSVSHKTQCATSHRWQPGRLLSPRIAIIFVSSPARCGR